MADELDVRRGTRQIISFNTIPTRYGTRNPEKQP
jgi:hypothetical protein